MTRPTGNEMDPEAIEGELIEAEPGPVRPKPRRYRLTDARGIRRELSSLYSQYRNGDLTGEHARTCTFILRTLLESIRIDDIDNRLKSLEEQANGQQLPRPTLET